MTSQNSPTQTPRDRPAAGLLRWLVFAPLVLAALFCCGQLALMSPPRVAPADTHSQMKADYGLWKPIVFQPLDPAILEAVRQDQERAGEGLPEELIVAGNFWLGTSGPALPSATPTSTPTASLSPTLTPSPTPAPTDTPTPSPSATPTSPPTPRPPTATLRPVVYPTSTRRPTNLPTSVPTYTPTRTITRTPTVTRSLTPTLSATSTLTRTPTRTLTRTPTRTRTPRTPTHTSIPPTPTETPTDTPVAPPSTNTPTIIPLPRNIEIGTPDGNSNDFKCGSDLIIDLGASTEITSTTLVFYEYYNPSGCSGGVCVDWVYIDVSNFDPTQDKWNPVFNWGDGNGDNNGNILSYHFPVNTTPPPDYIEADNEPILPGELYVGRPGYHNGILILVDYLFRYIRITAPDPCYDDAQLDAFDVWTPTPSP